MGAWRPTRTTLQLLINHATSSWGRGSLASTESPRDSNATRGKSLTCLSVVYWVKYSPPKLRNAPLKSWSILASVACCDLLLFVPQDHLFSCVQRGDLNRLITLLRKHPVAINDAEEVSVEGGGGGGEYWVSGCRGREGSGRMRRRRDEREEEKEEGDGSERVPPI